MRITHEIIRLFWKLFVNSYKESSLKESKISPFLILCPSYLNTVKIIDSSWESHKSRYFEILHEVLITYKFKICPLFTRSLNVKKTNQKYLPFWNLLASSYQKKCL